MKKSDTIETLKFIFFVATFLLLGMITGLLLQLLRERTDKISSNDDYNEDQRIIVQDTTDIKFVNFDGKTNIAILVDRETDVEYMIIGTGDGVTVQPLYNPDGSLRTRE